jgi:hypothetical protein
VVTEYGVREAVLMKQDGGSVWQVTFAPANSTKAEEIVVKVSRARLEQMSFAAPYTLAEIEAIQEANRDT